MRTLSKNKPLVNERRRHIVRCSMKILDKKGYHKATVRELAEACELSIGAFYHYFGSKKELLYYVMHTATAQQFQYIKGFAQGLESVEPKTALAQLIERHYRWHDENDDITLFVYQETKNLPQNARQEVFDTEARIHGIFVKFLRKLNDSGQLDMRDLGLVAHNIVVLGHVWALRRWFLRKNWTFEAYVREQTNLVLNALTSELPQSGDCESEKPVVIEPQEKEPTK